MEGIGRRRVSDTELGQGWVAEDDQQIIFLGHTIDALKQPHLMSDNTGDNNTSEIWGSPSSSPRPLSSPPSSSLSSPSSPSSPSSSSPSSPSSSPRPLSSPPSSSPSSTSPRLPKEEDAPTISPKYSEEGLKQKYLYTQKYKDGIDEAELEKLLKLKRDNSDNLYNDQYSNNKIAQLSSHIDIFNKTNNSDDSGAMPEDYEDIIAKLKGFENDPKNPIEALKIKFEDRLVFIIATFFIRYVAISMIQRGIDINLITTFYDGFIYYGCIYLVLFWFVVLFINIDDKYTTKYIDTSGFINYIRSLFYYFYMGTNGISRLLIHSLLLIVIIIIPIILNIKNKNNVNTKDDTRDTRDTEDTEDTDTATIVMLTLEERTKLSKLLSVFTLFIWILTSLIATKF